MKRTLLLFLIICLFEIAFGQNQNKVTDSLIQILKTAKEDTSKVSLLNSISWSLWEAADYDKAMSYAKEALSLAEKMKFRKGLSSAYNLIGINYRAKGNYPEALSSHLAALSIAEEMDNKRGISISYLNIGAVYSEQHNYPEALKNYFVSLSIAEQNNDKTNITMAYNNIGTAYQIQRNYPEALKNYSKALKAAKDNGQKQIMAYSLGNIGNIYKEQHNYAEALSNYTAALEIVKELGDKPGIVACYVNLGGLSVSLGKYNEARAYLNRALGLSKEIGNKYQMQASYIQLSRLDSIRGNLTDAYNYLRLYSNMKDSILNENFDKQIVQLKIQYETEKKEKENMTLSKNNELLNKEKELQAIRIEKQKVTGRYLVAVFLLIAVSAFISFRLYNQKRKATFLRQVSETKMKALRAQMNPHFIYNSINSVYRYMKENDLKSAEGYLISFSKLIRQVLENSLHNEVTLNEELRSLELYLALEAQRMNNKFVYKINVADDIDRENTLLPPLLIEPFVENAIWHGMKNKEGDGKITISIVKDGAMLKCIIEDNGGGRQHAEIKTAADTDPKGKQSLGMKLTEERIATMNQTIHSKATVTVIDLFDEAKKPAGVKVVLSLPLQLNDD